jgi:hypothetical protein
MGVLYGLTNTGRGFRKALNDCRRRSALAPANFVPNHRLPGHIPVEAAPLIVMWELPESQLPFPGTWLSGLTRVRIPRILRKSAGMAPQSKAHLQD